MPPRDPEFSPPPPMLIFLLIRFRFQQHSEGPVCSRCAKHHTGRRGIQLCTDKRVKAAVYDLGTGLWSGTTTAAFRVGSSGGGGSSPATPTTVNKPRVTAPLVATVPATGITLTQAVLNGSIISTGGATCIKALAPYGTTAIVHHIGIVAGITFVNYFKFLLLPGFRSYLTELRGVRGLSILLLFLLYLPSP